MNIKKTVLILFLVTFCFSCSTTKKEDLKNLNGYWEIKEVKQENGKEIVFKFNEMVDFIEIKNLNGIRKKVQPSLEGGYKATNDAENFTISQQGESWVFHYQTELDEWTETLLKLNENEFIVKNNRGITYTYQRFNGYLDGTK